MSKQSWLIGSNCVDQILSIWKSYRSKSLALYEINDKHAFLADEFKFKSFRLCTLGMQPFTSDIFNASFVVTSPAILEEIEKHLKSNDGRSLQKIVSYEINSQVLTDVLEIYPQANSLAANSISFLKQEVSWMADMLNLMLTCIIPIFHQRNGLPFRRCFSNAKYLRAYFMSFVERKEQNDSLRHIILAIDIAHELAHQVLMLYQHADPIFTSSLDQPIYSPIRKVERPAILAFHGCVASSYMMEVCQNLLSSPSACSIAKQFACNSLENFIFNQKLSLNAISRSVGFTQLGKKLFDELEIQLQRQENSVTADSKISPNSYFGLLQ